MYKKEKIALSVTRTKSLLRKKLTVGETKSEEKLRQRDRERKRWGGGQERENENTDRAGEGARECRAAQKEIDIINREDEGESASWRRSERGVLRSCYSRRHFDVASSSASPEGP